MRPSVVFGLIAFCFTLVRTTEVNVIDTSALFDGDAQTVWQAPEWETTFFAQSVGCFDQVRILSSSDLERRVAGMTIQGKDERGKWVFLQQRWFDCPGEEEQVFKFRDEICHPELRITVGSCNYPTPLEMRDLYFESSPALREKRQVFRGTLAGSACTTTAECAAAYISFVECANGQCVVPECLSNSDCPNPKFPVCEFFDLDKTGATLPFPASVAGIPRCSATCTSDSQCTHIARYPKCSSGQCLAEKCRYHNECTDPNLPTCDPASGLCVPGCHTLSKDNDGCVHFLSNTFCVKSDPTGMGCTPGVGGCQTGRCVVPTCENDFDCAAKSQNDVNCSINPNTPNQGLPYCTTCTTHQQCRNLDSGNGNWYAYCFGMAVPGGAVCKVPECRDNGDCVAMGTGKSKCSHDFRGILTPPLIAQEPKCVGCTSNSDCSLFDTELHCVSGNCIVPDCIYHRDCNLNLALPHCGVDPTDPTGRYQCRAGCTKDDECAQFLSPVRCRTATGVCVRAPNGCTENDDCTDPLFPVCRATPGDADQWTCQADCTTDDHCAHFNPASLTGANQFQGPIFRCFSMPGDLKVGRCYATCTLQRHCTDPLKPVCGSTFVGTGIPDRLCVAGCVDDEGCTQFTDTWQCKNQICVVPECKDDADCTDKANARCHRTTYTCVPCTGHDDCWHFESDSFCDASNTCVSPNCMWDRHCTDPLFPKCSYPNINPIAGSTKPGCFAGCMNNNDCSHFIKKRVCDLATNTCVLGGCRKNDDCTSATASICVASTCVPCTSHTGCSHMVYGKNFCVIGVGCQTPGCYTHEDCAAQFPDGSRPVCNYITQYHLAAGNAIPQCVVGCNDVTLVPSYNAATNPHVGCSGFFSRTWCSAGTCVVPRCYDNDDCKSLGTSRCNLAGAIPVCEVCQSNDDCTHFAAFPVCNGGCTSLTCWINSDCPTTAPVCTSNTNSPSCTATCTSDFDCQQYVAESYCVASASASYGQVGQCVKPLCRDHNDCTPATPMCVDNNPAAVPYAPHCAVGCTVHRDCDRFTVTNKRLQQPYLCNAGICAPATCTVNNQCTSKTASKCTFDYTSETIFPTCVACTVHDDCAQFAHADKCVAGTCVEPQCRHNVDCTMYATSRCDYSDYTCKTCVVDDDCAQFYNRRCQAGTCVLNAAVVAECFENYDCLGVASNNPKGSKPYCVIGASAALNRCDAACTDNDHCSYYAKEIWCVTDAGDPQEGQCIVPACYGNEECPAAQPRCSIQTPVDLLQYKNRLGNSNLIPKPSCGACISNDDCAHFAYTTECSPSGACVRPVCWEHHDCPADAPRCLVVDGQLNSCVPCLSNDDCTRFAEKVWCSVDPNDKKGECIDPECLTNYDCPDPNYPTCVTDDAVKNPYCFNLCVDKRTPGLHNDDCTRFEREIWCTLRGSCEVPGCLEHTDCITPTKPVCDLTQDPPKCFNVCQSNDDCLHFEKEKICVTDRTDLSEKEIWGTCVIPDCLSNLHCLTLQKPTCNLHENPPKCMAQCTSDDDCTHLPSPILPLVCITNPDAAFDARRGTCEVAVCHENHDCPDPKAPICNRVRNPPACEATCKSNDDCTLFYATPVCDVTTGMCMAPECQIDADCVGNKNGPACIVGVRRCAQCIFDSHCSAGAAKACDTASNKCVECTEDTHCVATGKRACVVSSHRCVQCVNNQDCIQGGFAGRSCDTFTGMCVECQVDADCTGNAKGPACIASKNVCAECRTNSHCSSAGRPPACHAATNQCVACLDNSHCLGGSVCDTAKQTCVGCLTHEDCSKGGFGRVACLPNTQTCVACTHDSHCSGATPACNTVSNTCVACTHHSHCQLGTSTGRCDVNNNRCQQCVEDSDCTDPRFPACDPLGACVECYTNGHCSDGDCDASTRTCVTCTSDAACGGKTPACDIAAQTCVECTSNHHCGDAASPVCDPGQSKCVACLSSKHCSNSATPVCDMRTSDRKCVECLNDAHCGGDRVCDLSTGSCLECTTASECWLKDPYKPICNGQGECVPCTEDIVCADLFLAYQACHTETGACVADTYKKGFYVSAIVLGTIATFFVIIAVIAVIAR